MFLSIKGKKQQLLFMKQCSKKYNIVLWCSEVKFSKEKHWSFYIYMSKVKIRHYCPPRFMI